MSGARPDETHGSRTAVESVSFDAAEGEFLVLLCPSGCGKTTPLRLIAGLATSDAGQIAIDGRLVSDAARNLFARPQQLRGSTNPVAAMALAQTLVLVLLVVLAMPLRRDPTGFLVRTK
jgi:ABC-type Fe3+/spermidine/putrescine transport system ATPase subunit